MRALVLVLGLLATPALAADQFDLVCKGTYQTSLHGKEKPIDVRYRIDLAKRSWCNGDCKQLFPIRSIENGSLILDRSDPADRISPYNDHQIDRVSGEYRHHFSGPLGYWDEKGSCEAAPFSGFPSTKF